jgi:hypothetical protein
VSNRLEHLFEDRSEAPELCIRLTSRPREAAWNGGQWLGLAGALFLLLGVCIPVFEGGLGLWQLDALTGVCPIFGPMMMALTCLALVAVVRRWTLILALVGLAAYATLAMAWFVAESVVMTAPGILSSLREPASISVGPGWVVLMLGAMLPLVAAAIGEYLTHRDRKPSPVDLEFHFPALARRHSLAMLQSSWELRN